MESKFSKDIFGTVVEKKLAKPECYGRYLATRIGNRCVLELCCCLGIQLIQIAKSTSKPVYGVDINPDLIAKARKNAKLYGVSNIRFITGNALDTKLLKSMKVEVAIMDPHWSVTRSLSRDYSKKLSETIPPADEMINLCRKFLTPNLIVQLPTTISESELRNLGNCEVQDVYVNSKHKALMVYYGDLVQASSSRIDFEFDKGELPESLRTHQF